jgi:transcriptional regulator
VDPLSVPTWNYIAIHAYGTLELVEDEAGKDALVAGLIRAHESAFEEKWRGMPEAFRWSMLAEVVGFRIAITRIEGKFKLSQNRAEVERDNVRAAHAAGSPDQQALAAWMARLETCSIS